MSSGTEHKALVRGLAKPMPSLAVTKPRTGRTVRPKPNTSHAGVAVLPEVRLVYPMRQHGSPQKFTAPLQSNVPPSYGPTCPPISPSHDPRYSYLCRFTALKTCRPLHARTCRKSLLWLTWECVATLVSRRHPDGSTCNTHPKVIPHGLCSKPQ